MEDYKDEYYEQSILWDNNFLEISEEKERIEEIIKIMPFSVQTILDVGCGNGAFINTIASTFLNKFDRIVGLDSSKAALKYVKVEKYNVSISKLPFENKSFDLVTSLEILEHLPQEDFGRGILEIQRVAKKYIIITVPNKEDIEHLLAMCPKCNCWFNPCFHMRSFDKNILCDLFSNFKLIKVKEIGHLHEYRSYNHLLFSFYRTWKKPLPPITAICPQCGYQRNKSFQNIENNNSSCSILNLLLLFKTLVKIIYPMKKKKRWLLALYEKADK